MYTCQPTVVLCPLLAWLCSHRCTVVSGEEGMSVLVYTPQCPMHLGELNFCNHHRAQPTAQIDCPQPPLTSHLLCPLLQVSSVVNNIIASLNNGSSYE